METDKERYEEYVKQTTSTHSLAKNMVVALLIGGIICVLGQFILDSTMNNMGMDQEVVAVQTLLELILLSILLIRFNIHLKIAGFGGVSILVPITGFANPVMAPAIELHSEGEVFDVDCRVFTIAGPMILYEVLTSQVLGLIYWTGRILRISQTYMDWEIFPGPFFLSGDAQLMFYGFSDTLRQLAITNEKQRRRRH